MGNKLTLSQSLTGGTVDTRTDEEVFEDMKKAQIARKENGQFAKGQTGNPSGRPATSAEFKECLRYAQFPALLKIISLMETTTDAAIALKCAVYLLDRSMGKPKPMEESQKHTDLSQLVRPIVITGEVYNQAMEEMKQDEKGLLHEERADTKLTGEGKQIDE